MTTPDEFFARYPRGAERFDARLREYFDTLTPAQQLELETAEVHLALVDIGTEGRSKWRLEVAFKLDAGTPTLCIFDALSIGIDVVDGEIVYIDEGHA